MSAEGSGRGAPMGGASWAALGRGVVVSAGDPVPGPWAEAPQIMVDDGVRTSPGEVVGELHGHWLRRVPVVVRLAVDPAVWRLPEAFPAEPWRLDPGCEMWGDRLHFLLWANTYDARGGRDPVWWWARKAERLGATPVATGTGDVLLPDGTAVWIDGGPRGPVAGVREGIVHRESVDAGRLRVDRAGDAPPATHLAPDQAAAVAHGVGPARVLAPAGSGKTRVLTERLRHLTTGRGIDRDAVLAVAYNRRAQAEVVARTTDIRPRVCTLNALGYDVLGRYHGARPPLLEEREVRRIVEGLVPVRRRRANTDPLAPYLEALSRARLGLVDPGVVEEERDDVEGFAEAFDPYRQELRTRGAVDFDEQIYGALEVLLRDGAFRRSEQARHRRLLVDEFQDLTPAHLLLVRLLAAPELEVFGVGDDDQVIYGHAGADPDFLIHFERYFPHAGDHPLSVNHRSPAAVVDAAVNLLGYNRRRVVKPITAGPEADPAQDAIAVRLCAAEDAAGDLVDVVRGWLDAGADPVDIAVLTRVNALLLAPHVALTRAGIPVASVLEPTVLSRTGVRAALAYLRIATNPGGFAPGDVVEILRRPSRGFPNWVERWFRGSAIRVADVRAMARRMDDARVAGKMDDLADDLQAVVDAASGGGTTREVLRVVRDVVGLDGAMTLLDAAGAAAASHRDDLDALTQVADLHPDPAGFEPWLREVLGAPRDSSGVTLSTVHRVKGQEWDHVAVYGVVDGVFPHRLATDPEEERRVMHVAITRGRRRVMVLGDRLRVSRLVAEMAGTARRGGGDDQPGPRRAVTPPRRPRHADVPEGPVSPREAAAQAALRAWRSERARRDAVPPYVVMHDAHLRDVARRAPGDMAALARCAGMGPTRLERYGDEIIGVLAAL